VDVSYYTRSLHLAYYQFVSVSNSAKIYSAGSLLSLHAESTTDLRQPFSMPEKSALLRGKLPERS
jgi:hypothetical protein